MKNVSTLYSVILCESNETKLVLVEICPKSRCLCEKSPSFCSLLSLGFCCCQNLSMLIYFAYHEVVRL